MLILVTTLAFANPIGTEAGAVQQEPGTHHVKFSWGTVDNDKRPKEILRDGEELRAKWVKVEHWQGNTGSGLVSMDGWQFCDCKVPVGEHIYTIDGLDLDFEVVDELEAQPVPGDTAAPWSIPAPVDQGLDCTETCGDSTVAQPASCATAPLTAGALLFLLPLLGLRRRR